MSHPAPAGRNHPADSPSRVVILSNDPRVRRSLAAVLSSGALRDLDVVFVQSGSLPRDELAVTVDDLHIDPLSRRCLLRFREIPLRAKEFDLLWMLAEQHGEVVSRRRLICDLWDEHWHGSTKTLDVTMVGLRRRLREEATRIGAMPPRITTVRGRGYRLESTTGAEAAS